MSPCAAWSFEAESWNSTQVAGRAVPRWTRPLKVEGRETKAVVFGLTVVAFSGWVKLAPAVPLPFLCGSVSLERVNRRSGWGGELTRSCHRSSRCRLHWICLRGLCRVHRGCSHRWCAQRDAAGLGGVAFGQGRLGLRRRLSR